jgi:hypothetical protein
MQPPVKRYNCLRNASGLALADSIGVARLVLGLEVVLFDVFAQSSHDAQLKLQQQSSPSCKNHKYNTPVFFLKT